MLSDQSMFRTEAGLPVPAVAAEQMREVDRVALQEFGLSVLQMMENAGRSLAGHVIEMLGGLKGSVVILAGPGGNGGGGICCARHLHNRGVNVHLVLSREPEELGEAAASQYEILNRAGVTLLDSAEVVQAIMAAEVTVDALIGYGLRGAPRGVEVELIEACNRHGRRVISLDLPSGLNATTGEMPGQMVQAERTLTLALPKAGLRSYRGDLFLADIGIPPQVYHRLGIRIDPFFGQEYWVRVIPGARDSSGA